MRFIRTYPGERITRLLDKKPTAEIFADKLRKIRFIFKEWENDINRTGEKLYR